MDSNIDDGLYIKEYEVLLKISEKVYDDSIDRFRRLEGKTGELIKVFSLLLTIKVAIVSFVLKNSLHLQVETFLVMWLCFAVDCIGLGLCIFTIKQQKLIRLSTDSSGIIRYFHNENIINIMIGYSK